LKEIFTTFFSELNCFSNSIMLLGYFSIPEHYVTFGYLSQLHKQEGLFFCCYYVKCYI
jgi:hypothetical protein